MANELLEPHPSQNPSPLDLLVARYAGGTMTSRELSSATGLTFGEILVELGKRNLALPRVSAERTPAQDSLLERALRGGE
ncbi:hypothetical protein [Variovorax ginsengisoli]|uniref:Uncharacterized protein n=1 Tax=Variovorax ginsengisoli TaxID=363844 RepID=A0ABT8SG53_9BURK|nr:hypothetical protein [Variovorax ginsengisoli]MDN8617997.1 hypothetical protein [Variovorax ginsengisoli]MDO1537167.1 hypothetical protein [Variovorax ginsengisoli]